MRQRLLRSALLGAEPAAVTVEIGRHELRLGRVNHDRVSRGPLA